MRGPVPVILPSMVRSLPFVSNAPPPALRVTFLALVKPFVICSVPPPPKVSCPDASPRLPSLSTTIFPALMVVPPEYVLAPERVSAPVPAFVIPPVPDITPEMVSAALFTVICRTAPPRSIAPDNVSAPVPPDAWPSVKFPPTTLSFAKVLAVVDDEARVPPERVSVPVPRAASSPTRSVPEVRLVPPE